MTRSYTYLIAVFVLAAMLAWSPQAVAQEYDAATIEAVNDHFAAGAQLYYDGAYDAAIAQFELAHAKIPNAIFLYNISLAHQKKGDLRKALATAKEADELGGLGEDEQVQNLARIVAMNRIVASQRAAQKFEGGLLRNVNLGVPGWTGIGLASAGVVGLVVVGILDVGLAPDVADHRDAVQRGDAAAQAEIAEQLRPRQNSARVVFAMSTVALTAGAGLLVYDLFLARKETKLGVMLAPSPDGVTVSLRHHF